MEEDKIIAELFSEGRAYHIVILILLSRFGPLTLQDFRVALGRERPASYRTVKGVLLELEEMGLVRQEVIGVYAKRKVSVYRLTEKGVRVARKLGSALGFGPPEGYVPQ
ncbi:MAG: hypothetical protein QXI90_04330 [Thermofilum sp.]